ncbi:extracellular solute-binding protein [Gracilibacillus caseinilyticus]|uniref:Extracellular solute-binding protein n=1 Tax=Gracilibacillus caseinilyticus TaxID=2932256 RepID=A0ABY4F0S7_9BACI|nr:extracellular solute-binding protein [Gracilibacillus caseinilyticus]UOQ50130.1 extracellular solute-binding protein [Gracilibacillus caseinilyticus]
MKKKIVLFIFVCLLLFLAACSNDEASNEPEETEDGRVVLTGLITKHPLTKELKDMEWLEEVEKKAGVDIKWEEVTADWDQKKGAMLAGGDIPDIIVGPNAITDADFAQFPGLFENLKPLIEEHGGNIQTMFEQQPKTEILSTQSNGEIYGLSKYQRFWPDTATMQFINQQWLDNLGLEVPTNWDELFDVLMAFKEEDANGNGDPNDEIPMDFSPVGEGGFGYFQPTVLLGSTGMTITGGGGQGYFLEDGKVKNFFTDERYKDLVTFLHKLYENGLISEEAFTQDYSQYQAVARGEGENAKVGYTFGWEKTDRFGLQVADQYVSFAPMKQSADYQGEVSWSYDYDNLNYGVNFIQMSSQTSNKEAAMRFINELYDPEVSLQVLFGSIGPNIEKTGDNAYKVLAPQDEEMDPGTWKWTSSWADNGPMYISDDLEVELPTDMQSVDEQQAPFKKVFESVDENDVFPGMMLKYSEEDNNKMTLVNTDFMNLAISKFGEWITSGGIDQQWDDYVKQVDQIGLPSNIEIIQSYYDDYKAQLD